MNSGNESAEWAAYWLERRPEFMHLFRDDTGQVQGFLLLLPLEQLSQVERNADPACRTVWSYLQRYAPLRHSERATLFRFWMAKESYQDVSPVQSRIFISMVQHYMTTSRLGFTFIPCAEPDFWTDVFAYADQARIKEADYEIAGRKFGVYGHDWRVTSLRAWLNLLADREIAMGLNHPPAPPNMRSAIVLNEGEFAEAIRALLREFHNPNALGANALMESRLLLNRQRNNDSEEQKIEALREIVRNTAETLQQTPKQAKFYRALHHTYFQPAPTQERAAELLDLPFSTYRRHLRSGIDFLVETLWQREIAS